jgi:uncharacterized protein (TIRG00374 family)
MNASGVRNGWRRLLPGLLVSGLAVLLLAIAVDWPATIDAWRGAQLWVVFPAFLLALAAMFTRALAWRRLMGNAVPTIRCFWNLNISYLLNGLLPLRIGDVVRAYLISRKKDGEPAGITTGAALSAVALERMFDLAFTCVLVLSVFPFFAGAEWSGRVLLSVFGLTLMFFLALLVLGSCRLRIMNAAAGIVVRIPFLRPLLDPLDHFLNGLTEVRDLRRSVPAFLWIVVTILLWVGVYWIVLRGFFPEASVYWGLLALIGGLIGVAMPSGPSSLGVFEGSVTVVLTMGGLSRDAAFAYAIAIHLYNIVVLSLLGALGLMVERRSLGSILAAARPAGNPSTERPCAS